MAKSKKRNIVKHKPAEHQGDDNSIIREIEDAVKKEQYIKFAKKHSALVVLVAVVFIVAVTGGKMWKEKQFEISKAAGEKIYLALNSENYNEALLTKDANDDINQISEFTRARLLADEGKTEEAEKLYKQIADNKNYDDAFRELATLTRASMIMNSGVSNKELKNDIEQVANNGKVFKYSGQEMLAAYELQFGDPQAAKKIFEKLIADQNTPSGIMLRAKQIIANI